MRWRLVALCSLLCISAQTGAQLGRDYDREYNRERNRDDGYKPNYQQGYGLNRNSPSTFRPLGSDKDDRFPNRNVLQETNRSPNSDLSGTSFYDSNRYGYNYNPYSNFIDGVDESLFCPEHWITFRQTCYRFIKSPKRSWYESKRICEAY